MIKRIIESIDKIQKLNLKTLYSKEKIENEDIEKYFYEFEKARTNMYEEAKQANLWLEFSDMEPVKYLNQDYKVELENNILKLHIPEKVPPIKRGFYYTQKHIIDNIANAVKKYKGIFYEKQVIVIIKIYDDVKIWDADNRNVKPIQDGLVHGKIIRDDNIYCASYMVQGYYSDKPHIEVFVVPSEEITKIINRFTR